ncbi:MAG: hypothetical protein WKG06_05630 [Segetibacter sp.]
MNQSNKRKFWFPFFPLIMIVMALVLGLIVMLLWNAVLAPVLHVSTLSYWQAVGLFILSRILFGGFRRGGNFQGKPGWSGGPPWRQKWMNMSEEERAKFRKEWTKRWHPRQPDQE